MRIHVPKHAEVTKTMENGAEYYVIKYPIKIEQVYTLLEHSRPYILGKEIARSNALALIRLMKQTSRPAALMKIYTRKIPKQPTKITIEIRARHFPKMVLYTTPNRVEVIYDDELVGRAKLLEAYLPRKKYINTGNKNTHGDDGERHYRRTRGGGLQKR